MKRALIGILSMVLTAACGGGGPSDQAGRSPGVPTPEPTPCVLEDASTEAQQASLGEDVAQVTDMRFDDSAGCPRIVFEFQDQISTYEVSYADDITECGTGDRPPVDEWDADAFLKVRFEPAGGPDPASEEGEPVYGGSRDIDVDGDVLKHIKVICDFEAVFEWVIALDASHPFQVVTMSDPARLVIDIGGA